MILWIVHNILLRIIDDAWSTYQQYNKLQLQYIQYTIYTIYIICKHYNEICDFLRYLNLLYVKEIVRCTLIYNPVNRVKLNFKKNIFKHRIYFFRINTFLNNQIIFWAFFLKCCSEFNKHMMICYQSTENVKDVAIGECMYCWT